MGSDSAQRVVLVGIGDLLEHDVVAFQRSGEGHRLLVVNVVV